MQIFNRLQFAILLYHNENQIASEVCAAHRFLIPPILAKTF